MKRINIILTFSLLTFLSLIAQNISNEVIPLYKGAAPGSESWTWNEVEITRKSYSSVYNVTKPSLTVFEADKSIATGIGVVVCPGGGFFALAIDKEGYDVAKWLNRKGITAFVLKYRLMNKDSILKIKTDEDRVPYIKLAVADGKVAMAYVKNHAAQWGLKRIGIMGFSAGGTVTTGVAFEYNSDTRPDFVAPVYPYTGYFAKSVAPEDAPPMFIAVASDDNLGFNKQCIDLYDKWNDAKKSAELHIYRKGGHGFGMTQNHIPTDKWIDRFYEWLMDVFK